jgi:membrane protease YdiL (CAAX protease family)
VKLPGGAVEKYGKSVGSVLNGELAITIIFILMSPFAEEILFRGIIFNVCSKFGDVFAIIFSSLAFALAHGQILWSIYTFFLGVLLCIIYRKYATIWAPILMHFSFNLASVAMILLSGNSIYLKFTSSEIFRIFVIFISAIFLAILTKKIFQRKTQKNDN